MKVDALVRLIRDLVKAGFDGVLTICFHHGGLREVRKEEILKE